MAIMLQPSTYLNLWKHRLRQVPESVWEQDNLETLVLADNDLQEIPAGIARLTGEMARAIAEVPPVIESLTGLRLDDLLKRLRPSADAAPIARVDTAVPNGTVVAAGRLVGSCR